MNKDQKYQEIFENSKNDDNIIGLILTGGRGKGFVNENSDYDIMVIVKDDVADTYKEEYIKYKTVGELDIYIFSISEFKSYAEYGSGTEWDRYNFAHIKTQVDKTGEIQELIDSKSKLPEEKIKNIVSDNLDTYINFYFRSVKNEREKNTVAQRLAAAESISFLLGAIFALEGRLRPYNKYVDWELKKYPLTKLPFSADEFIEKILNILSTGDIEVQKDVFIKIRKVFYENGYSDVIDAWEGKV